MLAIQISIQSGLNNTIQKTFRQRCKRTGDIVQRQPFPGPGLAIRIIDDVTPEKLAMLALRTSLLLFLLLWLAPYTPP